jgi:hypothetical protein
MTEPDKGLALAEPMDDTVGQENKTEVETRVQEKYI